MSTRYQNQIEDRDRLYYDAYEYCLSFQQNELYCIRGLPGPDQLDKYINQRQFYERQRYVGPTKHGTLFTSDVRTNLHRTQDLLKTCGIQFKLVVSSSYGSVYTNDLSLVDLLCKLPYINVGTLRQALVTKPRDTVVIRDPKYQYRTYFREREVPADRKEQLITWIESQKDHVKPSPATRQWLNTSSFSWRSKYMQRYYYIEHDSLQYETMLSLVVPGYVRKTVPVIRSDK